MKAAIIAGCATLLLATGAAHARPWAILDCRHNNYFRCGNRLVDVCDFGRAHSFSEVLSKEEAVDLPARYFHGRNNKMYFRGRECSCITELVVPEGGNTVGCPK